MHETTPGLRRSARRRDTASGQTLLLLSSIALCFVLAFDAAAQRRAESGARPITIPVTLRTKDADSVAPPLRASDLTVLENGETRQTISLRDTERQPLSLAVLIQDDVVPQIANEIAPIGDFIRALPEGSRTLVGYVGTGSLRVRQRFTTNAERAASALRIPIGSASAAPFNPYVQIREALRRFEGLPAGRRALLIVSDGLDISRGVDSSTPTQSIDLQRAIREAQRRGVAIYTFYAPTVGGTANSGGLLTLNAQSSLQRLADETGGRAFFQGTGTPVSFAPYLRRLNAALENQYALTYLSPNEGRDFRRIEIKTSLPGVEVEHPRGVER